MFLKATFIRNQNYIFRINTSIKFGDDTSSIGVFMFNPGMLFLKNENDIQYLMKNENEIVEGEVGTDPTLRNLIKLKENTIANFEGSMQIFNLFNLKNQNIEEAVEIFKLLDIDSYPYMQDNIFRFENYARKVLNIFNLFIIGWGRDSGIKSLEEDKSNIINIIESINKPYFGMKHNGYDKLEFMHLRNLSFHKKYFEQISFFKKNISNHF